MATALRDAAPERLAYVLSLATVTAPNSRGEGEAGSARAMRDAAARRAVWLSQLVAFAEADAVAQAQLCAVSAASTREQRAYDPPSTHSLTMMDKFCECCSS